MKMVRTSPSLSSSRSLLVLVVLLLALAAVAAGRTLVDSSVAPATPVDVPVEDRAPIAPTVNSSPAPPPAPETGAPFETAAPAQASIAPTATAVPPSSIPGPATTAAPGRDIHAIAPEPGVPGFNPPPGRE
jgi:hypothetical protein